MKDGNVIDHWDWSSVVPRARTAGLASFGQDSAGELYPVTLNGTVYRLGRKAGGAQVAPNRPMR